MKRYPADLFLRSLGLSGGPPPGPLPGTRDGSLPLPPLLPLVDVRSPAEFAQGHIPGARNLPLFSDTERAEVGTLYKGSGRETAMLRGLAHVGPRLESMAGEALNLAGPGGELALYCSRGGMRSASMGWLCGTAGLKVFLLKDGYKAFRRHVLEELEKPRRLRILGGRTGAGKTEVLRQMARRGAQVIDLEGLARHRGSAFGSFPGVEQPSSSHFENLLAVCLGQCDPDREIWLEDESENLGSANIPRGFHRQMREAPLTILDMPIEARKARVLGEYSDIPAGDMAGDLDRIKKRLGGLEHKRAHECLAAGDLPGLAAILLDYYDRAYDKQLDKRPPTAVIRAATPEEAVERLSAAY